VANVPYWRHAAGANFDRLLSLTNRAMRHKAAPADSRYEALPDDGSPEPRRHGSVIRSRVVGSIPILRAASAYCYEGTVPRTATRASAIQKTMTSTIWRLPRGSRVDAASERRKQALEGTSKTPSARAAACRAGLHYDNGKLTQKSRTESKKELNLLIQLLEFWARPAGFEPTTPWFVGFYMHITY
jgi:hypothetical protein